MKTLLKTLFIFILAISICGCAKPSGDINNNLGGWEVNDKNQNEEDKNDSSSQTVNVDEIEFNTEPYLSNIHVEIDNYKLVIEDDLLLLNSFKNLYKGDNIKDKSKFMDFLTIIYFVYDPRSDYSYIVNEDERLKEVCESNGLKVPKFTKEEEACIELYKQLTTTISSRFR